MYAYPMLVLILFSFVALLLAVSSCVAFESVVDVTDSDSEQCQMTFTTNWPFVMIGVVSALQVFVLLYLFVKVYVYM